MTIWVDLCQGLLVLLKSIIFPIRGKKNSPLALLGNTNPYPIVLSHTSVEGSRRAIDIGLLLIVLSSVYCSGCTKGAIFCLMKFWGLFHWRSPSRTWDDLGTMNLSPVQGVGLAWGGQPVAHMPQVAWAVSVCDTQQTKEGTGSTVAHRAGSRK